MSAADVAAVLVNYRAPDLVTARVQELTAGGLRAIVADNSGELVGSGLDVVECGSNLGFGTACNRAVAALDPTVRVLCLHNPDVDAAPAAIRALARSLVPGDGGVAPAVRSGGVVRTRGYHYPSPAREAYVAARAPRRLAQTPRRQADRRTITGSGRRFGSGALLVVERDAFDAVGGFDERFFLYGEDLDLWHRLGMAGRRTRFDQTVIVDHVGKAGSPLAGSLREILRWLGVELFAEKHSATGWRPYRHVHRAMLGRIDRGSELARRVSSAWRAGNSPSAVLQSLRPFLERGLE